MRQDAEPARVPSRLTEDQKEGLAAELQSGPPFWRFAAAQSKLPRMEFAMELNTRSPGC